MKRLNYEICLQETQEKGPQTIGQLGFFLVVARLRDGWVCPDMGKAVGDFTDKVVGVESINPCFLRIYIYLHTYISTEPFSLYI